MNTRIRARVENAKYYDLLIITCILACTDIYYDHDSAILFAPPPVISCNSTIVSPRTKTLEEHLLQHKL